MNKQKELILAALQYVKHGMKPGTPSSDITIKGFSDYEIGLVYKQLLDSENIYGNEMTAYSDQIKTIKIESLTGKGEMRLIELADEKNSQTVFGWFKRNWFPFLTLIITSGINLYKLLSEICK